MSYEEGFSASIILKNPLKNYLFASLLFYLFERMDLVISLQNES